MREMEWQPITIEIGQQKNATEPQKRATGGLNTSPEELHQNFLSDLGHLQEIHDSHQTTMTGNFSPVEANFDRLAGVLSTEAMLNRFEGVSENDLISLPLLGCELSGVQLSCGEIDGSSIIKLSVTGRDGSELEQAFALPSGSNLATATWDDGKLYLALNR